jgi:hypothetical protein
MGSWIKELEEWGDRIEEVLERPDVKEIEEMEVPDLWYAEDINEIKEPFLRAKEIMEAGKIDEQERELEAQLEAGEITEDQFLAEYQYGVRPQKSKLATRTALESVGMAYDDLGDLSEDWELLTSGDLDRIEQKERLQKSVNLMGPDASQELADTMLEEGKISKDTHNMISRQVRLSRK